MPLSLTADRERKRRQRYSEEALQSRVLSYQPTVLTFSSTFLSVYNYRGGRYCNDIHLHL